MIFLFSRRNGPLRQGADFLRARNRDLHPGEPDCYLVEQEEPHHGLLGDLGPDSQFHNGDCRLHEGEAVIVIGHGGDDNRLYDEDQRDVTDAALRLMARIAADNPDGRYIFFLAACGGAVRQPGQPTSLLSTLVRGTAAMAEQLLQNVIACWGYTASAGLVDLPRGVPDNRTGRHIYGILTNDRGVDQHCGYDCRITTRLRRLPDGRYITIYFAPALYPLQVVAAWADHGYAPPMETALPLLYPTVEQTSRDLGAA